MSRHPDLDPALRAFETRRVLLESVKRNAQIAADADHALVLAVVAARYSEVTWDQIGAQLGLSRQAAWKRFHRYLPLDESIPDDAEESVQ